jgi:hypothetical protein
MSMTMPNQALPVQRNMGVGSMKSKGAIRPSDCGVFKAIGCVAAVAACAATCVAGPEACIGCFAGVGASGCIDCL